MLFVLNDTKNKTKQKQQQKQETQNSCLTQESNPGPLAPPSDTLAIAHRDN